MKQEVFLAIVVIAIGQISATWQQGLTTEKIDEFFVDRCVKFGTLPRTKEIFDVKKFTKSQCQTLWNQFAENIKGRDPCKVTKASYGDWLKAVDKLYLDQKWGYFKNKATFWSQTKDLADGMSAIPGSNYLTLASMVTGYVLDGNGVAWCPTDSSNSKDGWEYGTGHCKCNVVKHFWDAVSEDMAEKARGKVYVLFTTQSSKEKPAYRADSVFGETELPKLEAIKKITEISVMLLKPFNDERKVQAECWDSIQPSTPDKSLADMKRTLDSLPYIKDIKKECIGYSKSDAFKDELCKLNPKFDGCKKEGPVGK
ncbi:ADP-ribosyl cyclase/cyclic ADP-ribose hydrolase-like [Clytia hemisphaerica]|uniref:ADP-ribosyl cyclase/cyclic ADP-ribose hydrolase n=1 Tax=Clytia hemisphaerica TaxID=252671 RepID=A0A7M5UVC8_9CNID